MQIELTQFMAAVISSQGGEVFVPANHFLSLDGEKTITIDVAEDGFYLRLIDTKDVPEDATD